MTNNETTKHIARLNDLCRKAPGVMGQWLYAAGIEALPKAEQATIFRKVALYNAFTEDNNPHGERDFGGFIHNGHHIFWKIDYYAPNMEQGSEDPADPKQTVRVLTIMLASEY